MEPTTLAVDGVGGGEPAADRATIESAIRALTPTQIRRLRSYAHRLVFLVGGDEQAIVQEAMLRIWSGKRRWNPSAVAFLDFLFGVVKSMASNENRKQTLGTGRPMLELEASMRSSDPQNTYAREDSLNNFILSLSDDAQATAVLNEIRAGFSGPEIRQRLDLKKTEYETIARRIKRKATALFPKGGNPCPQT